MDAQTSVYRYGEDGHWSECQEMGKKYDKRDENVFICFGLVLAPILVLSVWAFMQNINLILLFVEDELVDLFPCRLRSRFFLDGRQWMIGSDLWWRQTYLLYRADLGVQSPPVIREKILCVSCTRSVVVLQTQVEHTSDLL